MENEKHELQQTKTEVLPVNEMLSNVQAIQKVLKEVMILGCHFDKITGCGDKPVLLKAGAEKILSTFRIGVESITEDLGDDYERRYRITCRGFFIPNGNTVGFGIGEASTAEKKYAWRASVCDEEYNETPETHKRKLWKKGYQNQSATSVMQVRQNPSDIANTVLKMAKKRAMIDLCLTATACSDIFEQDLNEEAVQEHVKQSGGNTQTFKKPAAKAPASNQASQGNQAPISDLISENQAKRLFAIIMGQVPPKNPNGYTKNYVDAWLKGSYEIGRYEETPKSVYEEICENILNTTIPAPGV